MRRRQHPAMSVSITLGEITYDQPTGGLFINNEFVGATGGKTIESTNPATEEVIATVGAASEADVDKAVAAARAAFPGWKKVPAPEKGELLRRLAEEMKKDYDILTAIEAADSGKPRWQNANYDVEACIDVFNYYAGWADKIEGKVPMFDPKRMAYTRHEPFGVVGQIIPWNYPLNMASWKIGPAIAAGNCIVLKTAENTPLSMLYFGNLVKRAGFPPGVINIISGYGPVAGNALASHPDVNKIAFTGSGTTGRMVMRAAADSNLKPVTLELGGKSPMIVFDDCDVDQAAKWAFDGIMSNMGQICCGTSRLLVQENVYSEFIERLRAVTAERSVAGDPFDKNTSHGPQVSKLQFEKVMNYIDIGKKEGAQLVTGGKRVGTKGFFIEPTIFKDVTNGMRIAQEEIFGPVVSVIKFKTFDEALNIANDTEYGLGGAVFTKDLTKAHQAAHDLECGFVWINSSNDNDHHLPFSGFKMSGIGSELASYGLQAYLQPKSVQINLEYRL